MHIIICIEIYLSSIICIIFSFSISYITFHADYQIFSNNTLVITRQHCYNKEEQLLNQKETNQKQTGYSESIPADEIAQIPVFPENILETDSFTALQTDSKGQTMPNMNRCFKDSVFRIIFREKENLLSNYDNPEKLILYTLEDAV